MDSRLLLTASDTIHRIREVLERAGYTESNIHQFLDVAEIPPFRHRRQALPLHLWRTRAGSPLEILVRLFLLHQSVSVGDARRAVAPMSLEDYVEAGLCSVKGEEVQAAFELLPSQEFVLAADWPGNAAEPNPVMGIAASSRTLAQMTIRHHATRTLDLGTGCGVLAFLAAPHSEQVWAVDRNPRAVLMTQFNAHLNKVVNLECCEGDLFAPVHGQTFDLIFCNPPFVIAPEQGTLHTYSGLPVDQFCQTIVRQAPVFLNEGGYGQLLCNWVQIVGQDWRERLASWFKGTGCDAWVLHSHSEAIADYAFKRISEAESDSEQIAKKFDQWMAYYTQEQIEAIGFGLLTMRRTSRQSNWFRCERLPEVHGACGNALAQKFVLTDFLTAHHDDRALLEARVHCTPNMRWEQHSAKKTEKWTLVQSRLQITEGLRYTAEVDPLVSEFVVRCNGNRRVRTYLQELATATKQDKNRLTPGFLNVVRRLIELGFLLPVLGG
jgi:SAM-dependent methyltransferase